MLVVDIYRPRERIPHACGGEPIDGRYDGKPHEGIPHACGGEPSSPSPRRLSGLVFPTRVGVNRRIRGGAGRRLSIPHACGGEPWTTRL